MTLGDWVVLEPQAISTSVGPCQPVSMALIVPSSKTNLDARFDARECLRSVHLEECFQHFAATVILRHIHESPVSVQDVLENELIRRVIFRGALKLHSCTC